MLWSSEEKGESWLWVFLPGRSVGGRKRRRVSVPRAAGPGGRDGASEQVHRTKNRMSTTSKMTKRMIIAHHCLRSGRKRKGQSSCLNREGKPGELLFAVLLETQGKPRDATKRQSSSSFGSVPHCNPQGDSVSPPGHSWLWGQMWEF